VPGALSGQVLYNKSIPLASLEPTVEVPERIGASGEVVEPLDEAAARDVLRRSRPTKSRRSPSHSSMPTRMVLMSSASEN